MLMSLVILFTIGYYFLAEREAISKLALSIEDDIIPIHDEVISSNAFNGNNTL